MKELEQHTVDTEDGYRLVLQRLNGGEKGPVIMCHGLSGNSYEYLLSEDERSSLARYLANRGYDSWVVDLRGHGNSEGYFVKDEAKWDFSKKAKGFWKFYVDDLIQKDTPAIIEKIKEVSNSDKVSWIGRSMGGWLAYAHAIDGNGSRDFKGVISIASPSHFSPNLKRLMGSSPYMNEFLNMTSADHFSMASFPSNRAKKSRDASTITSKSTSKSKSRSRRLRIISDESRYVFEDFLDFLNRGEIVRHNYGKKGNLERYGQEISPSYWENFGKIDVPIVFITGTRDLFASPESTTESYNRIKESQGQEKAKLHILRNYGHINILFGKNAYEDVYPLVLDALDWFE